MKKIALFIVIVVLGAVSFAPASSNNIFFQSAGSGWECIGPFGGNIEAMAFNPRNKNEIYALAVAERWSQVFKTSNSGESWQRIASLNTVSYDLALDPINPQVLYVLSPSGILKSTNRGSTWSEYSFGTNCFSEHGEISIHPLNSKILYASGYYCEASTFRSCIAVFKSLDGGKTWALNKVEPSSKSGAAYCVSINPSSPNIIYLTGQYFDSHKTYYKVFKSIDEGAHWIATGGSFLEQISALAIDPANPSKIYAGASFGVWRSSDGGQTWQKNEGYVYCDELAIDNSNPSILYAGYSDRCYKSVDGGVNWTVSGSGISGRCLSLLVNSSQIFFSSSSGVYKSVDSGSSWGASHTGLNSCSIPTLAISSSSPNIIYVEAEGSGFLRSEDFGNSWTNLSEFSGCTIQGADVTRATVNPYNANNFFVILSNALSSGG